MALDPPLAREAELVASGITETLAEPPAPDFAAGDYGPLSTRWHAQSLSKGAAGVAILHGVRAQTGHGGWEPVHTWLLRATADTLNNSTGAGLWFGAPAVAHALTTAAPRAHPAALDHLDRAVADLAERRLAAEVRLAARWRPSPSEFDLVRGLTVLGAHLLTRRPEGALLRRVLQYLVRLAEPVDTDDDIGRHQAAAGFGRTMVAGENDRRRPARGHTHCYRTGVLWHPGIAWCRYSRT